MKYKCMCTHVALSVGVVLLRYKLGALACIKLTKLESTLNSRA